MKWSSNGTVAGMTSQFKVWLSRCGLFVDSHAVAKRSPNGHIHGFPANGNDCPPTHMASQNSSSVPARRSYDDPHSIACLVLFLLAAFVTIRPIVIPVYIPDIVGRGLYHLRLRDTAKPLKRHTYHLSIDLNVGPIAAVLVLLASKSIGIVEFRAGIKGVGDLHPYDILLLFLSLVLRDYWSCLAAAD